MALKTYTRLSDNEKITLDDTYLTASMLKRLGSPEKPEIPAAILAKAEGKKKAEVQKEVEPTDDSVNNESVED